MSNFSVILALSRSIRTESGKKLKKKIMIIMNRNLQRIKTQDDLSKLYGI
jgi:hypothetical protein